MEIILENTIPLLGFQFNVSGVDFGGSVGSGGSAAGWNVQTGVEGMVLGFSMVGAELPAGNGVLTTLTYTAIGDEACISNEVFALGEWEGGFYEINVGDCVALEGGDTT